MHITGSGWNTGPFMAIFSDHIVQEAASRDEYVLATRAETEAVTGDESWDGAWEYRKMLT